MAEERAVDIIKKLQKGDKVICAVCNKEYYDVSFNGREYSNYFHCADPDCSGSIHIQNAINID